MAPGRLAPPGPPGAPAGPGEAARTDRRRARDSRARGPRGTGRRSPGHPRRPARRGRPSRPRRAIRRGRPGRLRRPARTPDRRGPHDDRRDRASRAGSRGSGTRGARPDRRRPDAARRATGCGTGPAAGCAARRAAPGRVTSAAERGPPGVAARSHHGPCPERWGNRRRRRRRGFGRRLQRPPAPRPRRAGATRSAHQASLLTRMPTIQPFGVHSFVLRIPDIDTVGFFMQCSGLELSFDVYEYHEGGNNDFVHRLPGNLRYPNLVLSRGLTREDTLLKWFLATSSGAERKEITLTLKTARRRAHVDVRRRLPRPLDRTADRRQRIEHGHRDPRDRPHRAEAALTPCRSPRASSARNSRSTGPSRSRAPSTRRATRSPRPTCGTSSRPRASTSPTASSAAACRAAPR